MSGSGKIDIGSLHSLASREVENDEIQELAPDFYRQTSEFLGNLRKQEFDGVEDRIKESMIKTAEDLTRLLLDARIKKIASDAARDTKNLLDEEKYILDALEEREDRTEMILSATIHGRFQFLESVSQNHKSKLMAIRFLQDTDEILGADLKKYGPFKTEDIATVPYENAQALIAKDVATKMRLED